MATLEELRADWEALRQARAAGIKRVAHNGREVEYQSDAALAQAMRDLERQIEGARGRAPIQVHTTKGL